METQAHIQDKFIKGIMQPKKVRKKAEVPVEGEKEEGEEEAAEEEEEKPKIEGSFFFFCH